MRVNCRPDKKEQRCQKTVKLLKKETQHRTSH